MPSSEPQKSKNRNWISKKIRVAIMYSVESVAILQLLKTTGKYRHRLDLSKGWLWITDFYYSGDLNTGHSGN